MNTKLPLVSGELTDIDELLAVRGQSWIARSERGFEVLGYEQGFEVLEHPQLLKGPTFQYRLDQLGLDGEARRYIDMGVPNSEGEYRKRLRAPLGALFRPTQVAKLREAVRAIARDAVDKIDADNPIDLMEQLCWIVPSQTYCELVSIPYDRAHEIRQIGDQVLGVLLTVDRDRKHLAEQGILRAVSIVQEHLDARRENPGNDFTSVMIRQQEAGLLTEEELFVEAFSLLQASVDNTAHQMGNTFGALLTQRELWEQLTMDHSLVGGMIEEAIRLYPRFGTVFRLASTDVDINGVQIPAGSWVFVSTRAGQRDPKFFEDPNVFRTDRQAKRPLMFGAGPYNCLGQNLARMEIEESLLAVVDRFPGIRLSQPWHRRETNAVSETIALHATAN